MITLFFIFFSDPLGQVSRNDLQYLRPDIRNVISQAIGSPYLYGAVWNGSGSGADCSGIVMGICLKLGIKTPRTTTQFFRQAQFQHPSTKPQQHELQPLDVLIFRSRGSASGLHVALYLGDGLVLNTRKTGTNAYVFRFFSSHPHARYWRRHWVATYRPSIQSTRQSKQKDHSIISGGTL